MFTSAGYQSDPVSSGSGTLQEVLLEVRPEHINPSIRNPPSRNFYVAIGGSLIVSKDLKIRPTKPMPASYAGEHILNFPVPAHSGIQENMSVILSNLGGRFFLTLDSLGRIRLTGTFNDPNEELVLNIYPYTAKVPIQVGTAPFV